MSIIKSFKPTLKKIISMGSIKYCFDFIRGKILHRRAAVLFAGLFLKLKTKKFKSLKSLISTTYGVFFNVLLEQWRIRPGQVREEFLKLLQILAKRQINSMLEIGTNLGGTLFLFTRVINPHALIISLDLPNGPYGGGYPAWRIPFYKSFSINDQKMVLLREDSHKPSTLTKVEKILNESPLDFLFIDGDHSYDGVKADFEMYKSLVRPGGIIAFHDICPYTELDLGVNRFWNEIKNQIKSVEIIKDSNQIGFGIGILFI